MLVRELVVGCMPGLMRRRIVVVIGGDDPEGPRSVRFRIFVPLNGRSINLLEVRRLP